MKIELEEYFMKELKKIGAQAAHKQGKFETKEDVDKVIDFIDKTINKADDKEC